MGFWYSGIVYTNFGRTPESSRAASSSTRIPSSSMAIATVFACARPNAISAAR